MTKTYCTEIWAAVQKARDRINYQLIKDGKFDQIESQLWIIDWDKKTLELETTVDGHVFTEICQL